ncbi:MAG TPA: glycosyltransferase [Balneolaceae bacterium]
MISVIIPTHGRPDLLEKTLQSLINCKIPPTFGELVIVENGTRMGAEDLILKLPDWLNARYMYVEVANKSNALNKVLETIGDQLVFFTDDDAQFQPNLLSAYVEVAFKHGKGCFYGGPVKVIREEEPPNWLEPLLPYSARGYSLTNERMKTGYLGINWAAFASDIKTLGGFDIRFGPGSSTGATGQESDMQERMRKAGMKEIDVLDAVVWHEVPKDRCNEKWLTNRFFKYGISRGVKADGLREIMIEFFNVIKYSVRWFIYFLLLNKFEKKKSKMEFITRLGYFSYILTKN